MIINSDNYSFEKFEFSEIETTTTDFIFPSECVLGKQAEACFKACIELSERYRLLAANLQIQGANATLGELDYLLQDLHDQRTLHIELACKFYLYNPELNGHEEAKWIGPNLKDTLYDKLEKLKQRQFPMLYAPETIEKLQQLGIKDSITQQLCLKAFLFLPLHLDINFLAPQYQDCVVGHWIRFDDFINDNKAVYALPNKKQWLLPTEAITDWKSFSEIKEEIEQSLQNKKSPLVYKKTPRKTERFFVVWW